MYNLKLVIDESTLTHLIMEHFSKMLSGIEIQSQDINIMVKSKQNYKSEWEKASFKAEINKSF